MACSPLASLYARVGGMCQRHHRFADKQLCTLLDALLFGEAMATVMIAGIRRGLNVLLCHSLDNLLSNELKDGSLEHICLRVSLQ